MNEHDFWSLPGDEFLGNDKLDWKLRRQLIGAHICFGGKGGGGSSYPDPQIGQAALMQAKTGDDWLAFSKESYKESQVRQDKVDALTAEVTEEQLRQMKDSGARSDDQWERWNTLFKPVEDRMINDANTWDSEARQGEMAAEAKADVMSNAGMAQEQNTRQMASMGIDPRSGRYAGVDRSTDLATALSAAGAQNNARNQVRAQGMAMREGVVNLGRGATSTAAQQLGLGLQAGNSASGNQMNAENNWRANQQIMGQGFQGAMQGYAGQGQTLLGQNSQIMQAKGMQQQADAAKGQTAGAIVGTIGTIAVAF